MSRHLAPVFRSLALLAERSAHLGRRPLGLLIAAGVACTGDSPAQPAASCTSALTITVGGGTQPPVNWTPACGVQSVTVVPAAAGPVGLPAWQAVAADGIRPPVRVGDRPTGATVWGGGEALEPGAAYTVYVGRGGRGNPAARVDNLAFTAGAAP